MTTTTALTFLYFQLVRIHHSALCLSWSCPPSQLIILIIGYMIDYDLHYTFGRMLPWDSCYLIVLCITSIE
jgi:hypothetical protein